MSQTRSTEFAAHGAKVRGHALRQSTLTPRAALVAALALGLVLCWLPFPGRAASASSVPAPPPSLSGTPIDTFDDAMTPWTENLINRWQPVNDYHWSSPWASGTPYASGGGMWHVSTRHGGGFKFIVTPKMTVPSGGKMALIADVDHLIDQEAFLGTTEEWSGKFMFPERGNPDGFPSVFTGLVWEWHTETMSGNNISIDPKTKKLRFMVYDPATQWYREARARTPVRYNHWYSWRVRVKWSYGLDGFFKGWIDDQLIANFTDATLKPDEHPYLQFGYYARAEKRNEVWHAGIRKS